MARVNALGKAAYGAVFVVVLPVALAAWCGAVDVAPPPLRSVAGGAVLATLGALAMGMGMLALWRIGGGLPMNAFPPPRHVASGAYAMLPHPIYLGAVAACAGVSLLVGSGVGLWLATPLLALGCVALVLGYEGPDLERRFGADRPRALVAMPRAGDHPLTLGERLGAMVFVLVPWLLMYEGLKFVGIAPDAIAAQLPGEARLPVLAWTEAPYASAYLAVPLAFLLTPTRARLRGLAARALVATGVLGVIYFCLPVISPPRPVSGDGFFAEWLAWEQRMSGHPAAAFPSFHVVWAGLVAWAVAPRGRAWGILGWAWAVAVAASCWTTGMHAIIDVAAGVLCWWPLARLESCWEALRRACERLANSWHATRIGPVRVISHGRFAGIAAALGTAIVLLLAPSASAAVGVIAAGLVGAALWAQFVEGSPALRRPFGYYGFLLGSLAALGAVGALGGEALALAAAFAVAGPWVQAIGRLRCLVQGCCHGRPSSAGVGLRVSAPSSRVCKLAHLVEVPIHPTQLYSILANFAIGAVLARCWAMGLPAAFVAGMYLVLGGMARFAEEGYRGEPQTIAWRGLSIYQWLAIASVAGGMALAAVPSERVAWPASGDALAVALLSAVVGAVTWFAMGVDFPESSRRFARLSG